MNKLCIAGILQTYALKISHCDNDEKIIQLIKDLKEEFLRKEEPYLYD